MISRRSLKQIVHRNLIRNFSSQMKDDIHNDTIVSNTTTTTTSSSKPDEYFVSAEGLMPITHKLSLDKFHDPDKKW